jgi:hypothetical protein
MEFVVYYSEELEIAHDHLYPCFGIGLPVMEMVGEAGRIELSSRALMGCLEFLALRYIVRYTLNTV